MFKTRVRWAMARCMLPYVIFFLILVWIHMKSDKCSHYDANYKREIQEGIKDTFIMPENSDRERVFYNRVPKCGSGAMVNIIKGLSKRNKFLMHRSRDYYSLYTNASVEQSFVKSYRRLKTPHIFDRHVHFIDFTKYDMKQPVYINVIRDPLKLLISLYYFDRFQPGHIRNMTEQDRLMTFDECVKTDHLHCTDPESFYLIIPYFCGQAEICRVPGKQSLALAMRNVQKYYWFVGIQEDFPSTLDGLELMLPGFFKGAREIYAANNATLWEKHGTIYKQQPGAEAIAVMKERLFHDFVFYNFVKSRMYNQLRQLREPQPEFADP